MKKEFLLLSVLISSAILVYLIYPISNLKQLDEQNVTAIDKPEKPLFNQSSSTHSMACNTYLCFYTTKGFRSLLDLTISFFSIKSCIANATTSVFAQLHFQVFLPA